MDMEIEGQGVGVELRRLEQEHHDYAEKLENLMHKPYLSEDDKVEEIRLKKLKLRLKDQITAMRNQNSAVKMA